jgi:LacI family transcriptional regulator
MAVTIKDIAKASGYSRGTVDRALNNKTRISDKTKYEIKKIAEELGYKPDLIARSLVNGVTMTIGVVVFDISNRYFALLVNSIEKAAKTNNYSVIIMLQEKDPKLELKIIDELVNRKVDGIILCPVNKGNEFAKRVRNLTMPVVTVGNYISKDICCIGIDEKEAAYNATKRIISKGYEKIVFVCPFIEDGKKENIFVHSERLEGVKKAIKEVNDIEFEIISHRKEIETIEFYIEGTKRVALFCSGDMLALDIMKSLKSKNYTSPRDYGIMGFDGLDILDYVSPQLATISKPIDLIGMEAYSHLYKEINGEKTESYRTLGYTIVEGETI